MKGVRKKALSVARTTSLNPKNYSRLIGNKTGTSKVGAVSKAQKAQNIFFEKNEIFENYSFGKCRIVPEKVKEGPFGIY